MKKLILICIFFSKLYAQNTVIREIPMETKPLTDSSATFSSDKLFLQFDRTAMEQISGIIALSIKNPQTTADLNLVKAYIGTHKTLHLTGAEQKKIDKPYEKIKQDSLAMVYHYFPALACEMLNFGYCKITYSKTPQKKYTIVVRGTLEKNNQEYVLEDKTIFWIGSGAIRDKEPNILNSPAQR
jgi:hypothetical protein